MSAKQKSKGKKRAKASLKVGANVPTIGKGNLEFGLDTRSTRRAPVAQTRLMKQKGPDIRSFRRGRDLIVVIEHCEFVADVTGSDDFFLDEFSINPGLTALFPWLASVAENFESYHFKRLQFRYETQAPTTDSGTAMMAIDYDAADEPPDDKQQLMTLQGAVRSAVWQAITLDCPASDLSKFCSKRFVRQNGVPAGTDVKTYDVGNLMIATQGANTSTVGELYVSYVVELQTPTWEGQQENDVEFWNDVDTSIGMHSTTPYGGASPVITAGLGVSVYSAHELQFTEPGIYLMYLFITQVTGGTIGGTDAVTNVSGTTVAMLGNTVKTSTDYTVTNLVTVNTVPAIVSVVIPSAIDEVVTYMRTSIAKWDTLPSTGLSAVGPLTSKSKQRSRRPLKRGRRRVFCEVCSQPVRSCSCSRSCGSSSAQACESIRGAVVTTTPHPGSSLADNDDKPSGLPPRGWLTAACAADVGPVEGPHYFGHNSDFEEWMRERVAKRLLPHPD